MTASSSNSRLATPLLGLWLLLGALAAAQSAHRPQSAEAQQLQQAALAAEHGEVKRAYESTQDLLRKNPKFEPAMKLQGMLLEQMDRNNEAMQVYQSALNLAPSDSEVQLKLGVLQLLAGNVDESIKLLGKHAERVPQDGDALYYLAQAYHLKGDNDSALKAIQMSVKEEPNNPSVWQKYGELLCSSGENENALTWLKKAQHSDSTLPRLDFDLAVASYNNQDLENATQYAAKAVSDRPNDLEAVALLAAIEVKLGHWADAKSWFQKILSARSDDASSLLGLGHCELSLKNYQLAVPPLEQLLQQDPAMVLAHFYLSRAYAGLGRTADAEREAAIHRKLLENAASPNAK